MASQSIQPMMKTRAMADPDQSTSIHTGPTRDARGRSATLIDPFIMHRLRKYDTIPEEPLTSIAREIGSGWAKQGVWIFSYVWSVALVILVAAHFIKWGGGFSAAPRELRLWIVLLSLFVVNVALVWYFSRRVRLKRVHRILLKYIRCPHCGYDLRMLPTDPTDGATVCPECGCAWRLDDTAVEAVDGGNLSTEPSETHPGRREGNGVG